MREFREDAARPPRRMGEEAIPKKARERHERGARRAGARLAEIRDARRWLRWAPGTRL